MNNKFNRKDFLTYYKQHTITGFNELLSKLYLEYTGHMVRNDHKWASNEKSKKHPSHQSALECILINCYQVDYGSIIYSRSPQDYKTFPFSFGVLDSVLSWLKVEGYISNKIGYYDMRSGNRSRSKIRCREKLHSLFGRT